MTTEEFRKELFRLQDRLNLSDEQIQKILETHQKVQRGEITVIWPEDE